MENRKNKTWVIVFWIVTTICILQYLFIALPTISRIPNVSGAFYFGSLLPNLIIVFIFWLIKRRASK